MTAPAHQDFLAMLDGYVDAVTADRTSPDRIDRSHGWPPPDWSTPSYARCTPATPTCSAYSPNIRAAAN
ncbi:MAG TPA: hypothetical protein VGN37_11610 [Actinocatenispora sp.]